MFYIVQNNIYIYIAFHLHLNQKLHKIVWNISSVII